MVIAKVILPFMGFIDFEKRRKSMLRVVLGIFVLLHGLVHLLYFGQSARIFELQPGMVWPDGAWAFSKLLGDETTRRLARIFLVLAASGFVASGAGILLKQACWRPVTGVVALFSTTLYILFWDGRFQNLDNKGVFAILINIALLAILFIWKPSL
jgi:hypothetical protein